MTKWDEEWIPTFEYMDTLQELYLYYQKTVPYACSHGPKSTISVDDFSLFINDIQDFLRKRKDEAKQVS